MTGDYPDAESIVAEQLAQALPGIPVYTQRVTDGQLYLDDVEPCPQCGVTGEFTDRWPDRPGQPHQIICSACRGSWLAHIRNA